MGEMPRLGLLAKEGCEARPEGRFVALAVWGENNLNDTKLRPKCIEKHGTLLQVLVSLSVYRNDGGVFGGPLQLQIMELMGEMPRFNVTAKTVEGCKAALVGPSGWFGRSRVARCLSVAQRGYFAAPCALNSTT
jgi:hypothetical protein